MNLEVMLARKSAEGDDFDENADDTVNDEGKPFVFIYFNVTW